MTWLKQNGCWVLAATTIGLIVGRIAHSSDVAVLMFTAVILIWYSAETKQLRILSTTPGLTLRWYRPENAWLLCLSNQGKGTALNPSVIFDNQEFSISGINGINAISEKDSILGHLIKSGKAINTQDMDELAKDPIIAEIKFGSMNGRPCSTRIRIKNPPNSEITKIDWY